MNATHMMVSQGGLSLAGILWGTLATQLGMEWALFSASALGIVSAVTAIRWSIDFSAEFNPEPDPLSQDNDGPYLPDIDDGPITTALDIEIAPENHIRFFRLMKQIRLVFLRNGAFSARLDSGYGKPESLSLTGHDQLVGR